jgi:hypothetical protein
LREVLEHALRREPDPEAEMADAEAAALRG